MPSICQHPDCPETVKPYSGRGPRPHFCEEHSQSKYRKARSRADADAPRHPCGCKVSGIYAQCPQHVEHSEKIKWADPDPMEYPRSVAARPRVIHKEWGDDNQADSDDVRLLDMGLKLFWSNRVKGQWITETDYLGARIPVIGQIDLDVNWEPAKPVDAAYAVKPSRRECWCGSDCSWHLVTRGPEWPWAETGAEAEAA